MIEKYLGKTFACACGKTHHSGVERIEIGANVVEEKLVAYLREKNVKKLTLTCDENSYRAAGERVCAVLDAAKIPYQFHQLRPLPILPNEYYIGNLLMGMALDCDMILAVGSGVINDVTRYVSAAAGKPYCIVGTAPSMDGYISNGSALIFNRGKRTFNTHTPDAVFLDPVILANAPRDMIASGVGDVLGKLNCLTDWRLAEMVTGEWRCEFVAGIVEDAVETVIASIDGLVRGDAQAAADLIEGLLLPGICMDYAGNSRPASGCEHHMSHFWEMRYLLEDRAPVFHGTKVGIGTVIALKAYEYVLTLKPDFEAIRAMERMPYAQWEQEVREAFLEASDEVLELELAAGKNSRENLLARLSVIEEKWDEIYALAAKSVKSDVVRTMLEKLDAPVFPAQIGADRKMARQAIVYAKELRDRYTVLQLLWDLGELENFADKIILEYYGA